MAEVKPGIGCAKLKDLGVPDEVIEIICGPGLKKWGRLVATMPADIQKMGPVGYAKEHPGMVVIAVAALAHVIYHRGIIPKKR